MRWSWQSWGGRTIRINYLPHPWSFFLLGKIILIKTIKYECHLEARFSLDTITMLDETVSQRLANQGQQSQAGRVSTSVNQLWLEGSMLTWLFHRTELGCCKRLLCPSSECSLLPHRKLTGPMALFSFSVPFINLQVLDHSRTWSYLSNIWFFWRPCLQLGHKRFPSERPSCCSRVCFVDSVVQHWAIPQPWSKCVCFTPLEIIFALNFGKTYNKVNKQHFPIRYDQLSV